MFSHSVKARIPALARMYSKAVAARVPVVPVADADAPKPSKRQIKRQRMAKLATNTASPQSGPISAAKYVAADQMPQVPQEVQRSSPEDLYRQVYHQEPPQNHFVDFNIPVEHTKSFQKTQLTDKDQALLRELEHYMNETDESKFQQYEMDLTRLYYDRDMYAAEPLPEHYLRKSLSGMINLNPALDDIDDEYLWTMLPESKMFGAAPYEQQKGPVDIGKFSQWESDKVQEREEMKDKAKLLERKFSELLSQYGNPKSFYGKEHGRFKLNRGLLSKYKKLKADAAQEDLDAEHQSTKEFKSKYHTYDINLDNELNKVEIEIKTIKKTKN